MEPFRLKVSERLRSLLSYDKFAGPAPRILILESQYWLDGACANAARQLNWEIEMVPTVSQGILPREHIERLLTTLGTFRPDFILTVNLSGMDESGMFARLFEDLQIPFITWFVDDPRTIVMGQDTYASSYCVALTWDAAYCDYLREHGFPVAAHLPLAADTAIFNAEPAETWDFPPSFVGNSMIEFAEREWKWFEHRPALRASIEEAFDNGRVTREMFGRGLDAIFSPSVLEGLDHDALRHIELILFIEGTRRLRRELVQTLEPEGLQVFGDDGWPQIVSQSGGPINYVHDLPGFYRRCELNLNTTSVQMPTTVNQRVFDCPAAGGFLLTDRQPALADLFDIESETATYSTLEECRDLFRFYRSNPSARREIAQRTRQRILGQHTYVHRLGRIVEIVKERFG